MSGHGNVNNVVAYLESSYWCTSDGCRKWNLDKVGSECKIKIWMINIDYWECDWEFGTPLQVKHLIFKCPSCNVFLHIFIMGLQEVSCTCLHCLPEVPDWRGPASVWSLKFPIIGGSTEDPCIRYQALYQLTTIFTNTTRWACQASDDSTLSDGHVTTMGVIITLQLLLAVAPIYLHLMIFNLYIIYYL